MKKMVISAGFLAAVVLISGCRSTKVAGVTRSAEEKNWEQLISRSYPGYRALRAAAPAVVGNTEERVSVYAPAKPEAEADAAVENKKDAEANNVAAEVNKPADAPEAKPEVTSEPRPEVKPEVTEAQSETKPEVKPEAKPEAKPEVKADAKTVQPPDPTSGKVYVVKSGDTLGKIAIKHYGKAAYSNLIFKANSDILKNPNQLRPGMKLIVPEL